MCLGGKVQKHTTVLHAHFIAYNFDNDEENIAPFESELLI